jgi:hypothetical protein
MLLPQNEAISIHSAKTLPACFSVTIEWLYITFIYLITVLDKKLNNYASCLLEQQIKKNNFLNRFM